MSGFEIVGPKMVITKDARTTFDTSVPMARLVPTAKLELTDVEFAFPNLWRGVVYIQSRETVSGPPFDYDRFGCGTYTAVVPQEWGPDKASPNTIADITLGTVPPGTDYLDVMVKLTRTTAPYEGSGDTPFIPLIKMGEWMKLEGGSCVIERNAAMRRMFQIYLDGTTVKLRRRQSVANVVGSRPGLPGSGSIGNAGYYFTGTNAPNSNTQGYHIFSLLQGKGWTGGTTTHRPAYYGGVDPCSVNSSSISYASTYTGSVTITPGRLGSPT